MKPVEKSTEPDVRPVALQDVESVAVAGPAFLSQRLDLIGDVIVYWAGYRRGKRQGR